MTFTANSHGRLTANSVERLERLLGGDPKMEQAVLDFIRSKYGAANLSYLTIRQASAIIKRPKDFKDAVLRFQNEPF